MVRAGFFLDDASGRVGSGLASDEDAESLLEPPRLRKGLAAGLSLLDPFLGAGDDPLSIFRGLRVFAARRREAALVSGKRGATLFHQRVSLTVFLSSEDG